MKFPVTIDVLVLVRKRNRVRRRKMTIRNGQVPREEWLRDCLAFSFGDEFAYGEVTVALDGKILWRWPEERFRIPSDWECPTCGDHECPGCWPAPGQTLSCFV